MTRRTSPNAAMPPVKSILLVLNHAPKFHFSSTASAAARRQSNPARKPLRPNQKSCTKLHKLASFRNLDRLPDHGNLYAQIVRPKPGGESPHDPSIARNISHLCSFAAQAAHGTKLHNPAQIGFVSKSGPPT